MLARITGTVIVSACLLASSLQAAPRWASLIPFKHVEADPDRIYVLEDNQGPWLILAANFAGDGAEEQANKLVYELRKRHKMKAFVHRQSFNQGPLESGLMHGRAGGRVKLRYVNESTANYEAIAVLVGNFDGINDPDLKKTLEKIKFIKPACLALNQDSSQRYAGLRAVQSLWKKQRVQKGPMGSAFATRNPLLPKEFFAPSGVDRFIVGLNRHVRHSLLECRGNVTVRVATFRGADTINQREIARLQSESVSNKLEVAADRAHRLTMALRKQGVEAYEFHDRHESVVTVGSFETEGTPLPGGNLDIDPGILKIMKRYGANQQQSPRGGVGLQPQSLAGIPFDIQPMPMRVPRHSISKDYARNFFFK